jgi:hypothetical protein
MEETPTVGDPPTARSATPTGDTPTELRRRPPSAQQYADGLRMYADGWWPSAYNRFPVVRIVQVYYSWWYSDVRMKFHGYL